LDGRPRKRGGGCGGAYWKLSLRTTKVEEDKEEVPERGGPNVSRAFEKTSKKNKTWGKGKLPQKKGNLSPKNL